MTKQEAIAKAIERIKGQELIEGLTVASNLHPIFMKFLRYENEDAVVLDVRDNTELRFPRTEIFDVNKVVNVSNHYLNLGFWEEGMESRIISL